MHHKTAFGFGRSICSNIMETVSFNTIIVAPPQYNTKIMYYLLQFSTTHRRVSWPIPMHILCDLFGDLIESRGPGSLQLGTLLWSSEATAMWLCVNSKLLCLNKTRNSEFYNIFVSFHCWPIFDHEVIDFHLANICVTQTAQKVLNSSLQWWI